MDLNRMFVGSFIFLGMFWILFFTMPATLLVNVTGYSGATAEDKNVIETFNANDLIIYNQTLALDNSSNPFLQYGTSQSFDYGLPTGQELEFWWSLYTYGTEEVLSVFQLRHTNPGPFGWWTESHILAINEPYRTTAGLTYDPGRGLTKTELEALWVPAYNASYCEFSCDHITANVFIFPYEEDKTIGESWEAGYLGVYSSFEIDWDAMKPGAFQLLAALLFFQAPTLGIEGVGGTVLSYMLWLLLSSTVGILAFAIVTALIPLIRGWGGG